MIFNLIFWKIYFVALPIFILLDFLWVGVIAKSFYFRNIGHLMAKEFNWIAILFFYLIFIFGLVLFVIYPAIEKKSFLNVVLFGTLFGLVTYATYDFTNWATLKNWPIVLTFFDIFWGMLICCVVSSLTYFIFNRFVA